MIGCGNADYAGEQISPARSAVHHGRHASDPAVVALVKHREPCGNGTPEVVCSGVLIGERLVLTAAHCVPGSPRGELEVRFGEWPDADPDHYRGIAASQIHPSYDRQYDDHDLALLWLNAAAPAQPVPLPGAGLGEIGAGRAARVVGFGQAGGATGSAGEELEGTVDITSVGSATLTYEPAAAMTCRGDSGGPLFIEVERAWLLAGITTSGDVACEREGVAVRVDVHEADFVLPNQSPSAWPPPPSDDDCVQGACGPLGAECRCGQACPEATNAASAGPQGCALGHSKTTPALPIVLFAAIRFGRRCKRRYD